MTTYRTPAPTTVTKRARLWGETWYIDSVLTDVQRIIDRADETLGARGKGPTGTRCRVVSERAVGQRGLWNKRTVSVVHVELVGVDAAVSALARYIAGRFE